MRLQTPPVCLVEAPVHHKAPRSDTGACDGWQHLELQAGHVAQLAAQLAVLEGGVRQLDEAAAPRDVQRAAVLLLPVATMDTGT